jgi:hypothetical protein
MLTSFFSKSRPITFIIVALYISVFFVIANFSEALESGFLFSLRKLGALGLLLLSVFLLNFVSKRNELTTRNAYKTILFGAFVCMFLSALQNDAAILANLLVLLALRRIISLRTQRDTVQKIFDATFWIGIASVFYFWSFLFLFLVYFGILVHEGYKFKNWLVPIVALLVLFSIATSLDLLITDSFFTFSDWFVAANFDFSLYREAVILIPLALLLALTLWASFFYLGVVQKASASNKTSLFIILLFILLSMTVAVFAPTKNSSELIFFFAPLALIVTNYFQVSDDKWFREIILWLVLLLPFFLVLFF